MRRAAVVCLAGFVALLSSGCVVSKGEVTFRSFFVPFWELDTEDGRFSGIFDRFIFREFKGSKRVPIIVADDSRDVYLGGEPVKAELHAEYICGDVEIGPGDLAAAPVDDTDFQGKITLTWTKPDKSTTTYTISGSDVNCNAGGAPLRASQGKR